MKAKVAVMTKAMGALEFRDYEVPAPLPGDMVIKLGLANLCGSDLHFWHGNGPAFIYNMPIVLGHEMVGIVSALGDGVSTDTAGQPLQVGDRVVYSYFKPCGRCWACISGTGACPNRNHDWIGTSADDFPHFNGAYGEYYYMRQGHWVFKVPDELSDHLVSPVNCALSEVLYGLWRIGVTIGDTVLIQGAGGLGLYATSVAKEMGAGRVIVADRLPHRLELAKEFGADEVLDVGETTSEERLARIREWTNGVGADVAVELTGNPACLNEGIDSLCQGGRYLWIGCIAQNLKTEIEPARVVRASRSLIGVIAYEAWVIPRALDFLRRRRETYPFHKICSHTFPFEKINEAFAFANEGKAIRVSVSFSS